MIIKDDHLKACTLWCIFFVFEVLVVSHLKIDLIQKSAIITILSGLIMYSASQFCDMEARSNGKVQSYDK
jgi:hypothetical protein